MFFNPYLLLDEGEIYNVNENLKEDIFSRIPSDFTKLEQALFIYNELCHKLNYSLDYYLDEDDCMSFFTNAKNIEKVDGKRIKDVVCYTFDRIFLKLLYDREIISKEDFWDNAAYSLITNSFSPDHSVMEFGIDGVIYSVDATMGVFKNSDLSQAKFSDYKINGWNLKRYSAGNEVQEFGNALKKIQNLSTNKALQDDVFEYLKTKYDNNEFKQISLEDRANIYMDLVCNYGHFKEVKSLSYAYKLKHLMFTPDESSDDTDTSSKIAVQFVFNTKKCCPSVLVVFNVDEKLKTYQLDLQEPVGVCEKTTYEEIQHRFDMRELKTEYWRFDMLTEPVKNAVILRGKRNREYEARNI